MDPKNLVVWALEASMHAAPRRPGLTPAELVELGAAFGVDADHVHFQIRGRATEGARILPFAVDPSMFGTYAGDLRSLQAFDHVVSSFDEVHRRAAGGDAWASREAIVAAGEAAGLPRADVEYAVANLEVDVVGVDPERRAQLDQLGRGQTRPARVGVHRGLERPHDEVLRVHGGVRPT